MENELYKLMDWSGIEAVVGSETDHPHQYLGPRKVSNGILFQTFFPDSENVTLFTEDSREGIPMVRMNQTGYYAALVYREEIPRYFYRVTYEDGDTVNREDPYRFGPQLGEEETRKFNQGINYEIYKKLGAHPVTVEGTEGVLFAVWAPFAVRVSVVGDFNHWDGRTYPMRRLNDSGIFELFVPGIGAGMLYKYEIKAKGGLTYLKADPYANASELRPGTASIVADLDKFDWTDEEWLRKRASASSKYAPVAVYEVNLATFRKSSQFYNYRELAPLIAQYVKDMGYTHIELMPVMEHYSDESLGYEVTGYYAPTARYGSPSDFMFFMNYMHEQGIGVILDWVPSQFAGDSFALAAFDGTFLYEHMDPRKGVNPKRGTLLYNYGRPEVSNFLIANALFWKNIYHADGLRMDSVASMLYLDYDRRPGEWIANRYGGNVNLEAVEFFKHLNSIFKKQSDGAILIAEDSSGWPDLTSPVEENGLGFDYRWNTSWTNDFIGYVQLDPIFRAYHHNELTMNMDYVYTENCIAGFPHNVITGQGSMFEKMPGRIRMKFANLRVTYGYLMTYPGKKLLFMGEDFGQKNEWNYSTPVQWENLEEEEHKQMRLYMKDLLTLYSSEPALYQKDYAPDGFEWVSTDLANENLVIFLRRGDAGSDDLLVVCNFSAMTYEKHGIGVPYSGKFKEIFNSDSVKFGGMGNINPRIKSSKKEACDGKSESIQITVPPMGITIIRCMKTAVPEEN